ncbi:MAG: GSCFA domain-containing protein [Bacteroidia bacterium]
MNFKLDFDIKPPEKLISIRNNILLSGSCFAENIGNKLVENKWNTLINPHGILFNPESIYQSFRSIQDEKYFTAEELFEHHDLWHSWYHHGEFSGTDKTDTLSRINRSQKEAITGFKRTDCIIITFGSAFIYRHRENNEVVANCHKVPQKNFKRELLSVDEIVNKFGKLISSLKNKQFIFTVSPVRYSKDGIAENNLGKAVLIQSVHEICKRHGNAYYFPAYEIVIDELRDYRWFKEDLCHPNRQAIEYVWERFSNTCFDEETKKIGDELNEILTAKEHRPLNPGSELHQNFLENYLKKTEAAQQKYPFLNLSEELGYFGNQQP